MTTGDYQSCLFFGSVYHRRHKPVSHKFRYRVFGALIDLDELPRLDRELRWFSRDRFNLFSFRDRDYGEKRAGDLAAYIRRSVSDFGVDASGPLRLLCYPRILGYAFNPLAVYYCHDRAGRRSAVLYEVSSTFGERHSYLIRTDRPEYAAAHMARKDLHVSPFMEMEADYSFRLHGPGERIGVHIRQTDEEGPLLDAVFTGARTPLSDAMLLRAFRAYPLMTLKVVGAIHWEAVRLMLKGMKLLRGRRAPAQPISLQAQR